MNTNYEQNCGFMTLRDISSVDVSAMSDNDWYEICGKEWALPLLMNNPERVPFDWYVESDDFAWTLPLLMKYPDRVDWPSICCMEWALPLMEKYPERIVWRYTHAEEWNIRLMVRYPQTIDWDNVRCDYICRENVLLCVEYPERFGDFQGEGRRFSLCDWALPLLEKYPNLIHWNILSSNEWALPLLEKYPERVVWETLSSKEWALPLLEKYPERVVWKNLSWRTMKYLIKSNQFMLQDYPMTNSLSLIEYDYGRIKGERGWIFKELNEYLFQPKKVGKWLANNPNKHIEDYM